jgi:hypothetical protein
MSGRTLVVATWGHPAQWYNVMYSVGTKVQDFRCCTSLIPLLGYLEGEGEGVDVALVALNSLVEKPRGPVDSPCYRCYESLSKELESLPRGGYGELREALKVFLRRFLSLSHRDLRRYGVCGAQARCNRACPRLSRRELEVRGQRHGLRGLSPRRARQALP